MFDSLFEALFKTQGPEMVASITDVIKGREMGIVESAFKEVPTAVADMEQDEAKRIRNISVISDAIVSPTYVSMSDGAKEVHDENTAIVQKMTTGIGPDDIDLRAPEQINPVLFDGMSREAEGRDTVARMTDARARLQKVHDTEGNPSIIENFESLPTEPVLEKVIESETPPSVELRDIRSKLEELYAGSNTVKATNDEFGLAA